MNHGLVLRRMSHVGPLLVAIAACDGTAADISPPAETSLAQVSPATANQGNAHVAVIFNAAPKITSMVSSDGRVASNTPVTLQAVASDADGDVLAYSWTSNCLGAFDSKNRAQVTFVPGTLAEGATCAFNVDVSDGRGGAAKGTLSLSSAMPMIDVAPAMGIAYQSTDLAHPGDVVVLHATAVDPEGETITWTWTAADGTIAKQFDQPEASEIHWQAPATAGVTYTIIATATDPEGASASFKFKVKVSE